jgi:hypothetical protein
MGDGGWGMGIRMRMGMGMGMGCEDGRWLFSAKTVACLDMIEKNMTGVLALLNEECKMPKGNDENLLRKIVAAHGRNKFLGIDSFGLPYDLALPSNLSFIFNY